MDELARIQTVVQACHDAAAKLIDAANAVLKPGSYHISYHLAALALEEVGKASMVVMDSRRPRPRSPDGDERSLMEWIDDHERKLFWAIWLPMFHNKTDWQTIPWAMKFARSIHQTRLDTLYLDPSDLNSAASITEEQVKHIIDFANICLEMERSKTYRNLSEQEQNDLKWFFSASRSPEFGPLIFSKGSLEKQEEFKGDQGKWIRWLRETLDEMERINSQLGLDELNRVVPEDGAAHDDKFRMTIRLVSWSHSIRQNQLNKWNEGIDKIKLSAVQGKPKELIVQFVLPKLIQGKTIYTAGYQNCLLFVAALNMATTGFFWWYVPTFISRYYEKLHDLELDVELAVDRNPKLDVSWGHLAMKEGDYNNVGGVWTFLAKCVTDPKKAGFINGYCATLGLMAKSDIFGQFEIVCLIEFMNVFRAGLFAFGDWDGSDETLDATIEKFFRRGDNGDEIVAWVKDTLQLAKDTAFNKNASRPITVEEVAKAKIVIDLYMNLKVREFMPAALAEFKKQVESAAQTEDSTATQ
jgi:AbiV family abortive infection protein